MDYNQPEEFHQLARGLSTPETRHYGYSLNYSHRVFGTHLCDFKSQTQRESIVAESKRECQRRMQEYNSVGARCLRSDQEPVSDYRNITCYHLAVKYGVKQWLEHYFRCGRVQIDKDEVEPYSTFSETIATYHLMWTYPNH